MSRSTLWLIEKGDPGVAMGNYLLVLFVLGLENDLGKVAGDDVVGRKWDEVRLIGRNKKSAGNQ